MKRIFSLFISMVVMASGFVTISADEKVPVVSASSYVLYCRDNGKVILSNNMNTPMGMASTTKIMTALITSEYADKEDKIVEFTSDMIAEGSSMYLKVGDKVHLSDLVKGMMTVSGNDAANAAAIAVGGSIEKFVDMMNLRAKEIGMKNTHFANPSGLPENAHYSTAYDMALLMAEALRSEEFRKVTSQKNVQVDFVHPPSQRVTYTNHNRLLSSYEYCTGGKTGYTKSDGRCLVTCAVKDNLELIAVTLRDPQDWNDHKALYEYGFSTYKALVPLESQKLYSVTVASSLKENVKVRLDGSNKCVLKTEDAERVKTSVYLPPLVFAPVEEGQILGRVVCTLDSQVICEGNLVAEESAEYVGISGFLRFFRSLFR